MRLPPFVSPLGALTLLSIPVLADASQPECAVNVIEVPGDIPLNYGCHTVGARIDSSVDSDLYTFAGLAGDQVRLAIDQTSNNCMGLAVEVFGPNGFHEATSCQPNCLGSNVSCSLLLPLSLVDDGDYAILVSDPGHDQAGTYTLQLERIFPVPLVPALAYGVTVSSALSPSTDTDFYPFHGEAGSLIGYSVDQTSNNCVGLRLEIFDPTGARILNTSCQPNCLGSNVSCSLANTLTLNMTGEYLAILSDPGIDQAGTYRLQIECVLGCPPLTSTIERNGSGVNTECFDPLTPPVLGGVWSARVDASGNPGARLTVVHFYARPHPGRMSPWGEILVDTASQSFCHSRMALQPGETSNVHCLPIPSDLGLLGLNFSAQAISIADGPMIQLCNAIDYMVGY